jgi:DHA2 family multidrug resistance protein-like MFS transporter
LLFTAPSGLKSESGPLADLFLASTDKIAIRVATAMPLLFNVLMVVVARVAIALTVPRDNRSVQGVCDRSAARARANWTGR